MYSHRPPHYLEQLYDPIPSVQRIIFSYFRYLLQICTPTAPSLPGAALRSHPVRSADNILVFQVSAPDMYSHRPPHYLEQLYDPIPSVQRIIFSYFRYLLQICTPTAPLTTWSSSTTPSRPFRR